MSEALKAMNDAGLAFGHIVFDGRFHRAHKPNDAQWYVGNEGRTESGKPWCMVSAGDFRETGGEHTATAIFKSWDKGDFTRAELKEINADHRQAKEQVSEQLSAEQEEARQLGMQIWSKALTADHPYLCKKRLPPGNTSVYGKALLIPLYTLEGEFSTLQMVLADGFKKNMPGGKMAGRYHPINYYFGHEPKVYVAEGWATAAAIAKVRQVPVVAAFSAGNLLPVAKGIRCEKPDVDIVIAADNDRGTSGNPGLRLANKAAAAVGGTVVAPEFSEFPDSGKATDWWDYFSLEGQL